MSPGAGWGSSITSALISAVVGFMLEHFEGSAAVELLKNFFLRSWFVWLGLGVGMVVWALTSVWRVTHARDDEFTKWFGGRKDEYDQWLRQRHSEVNEAFALRFERLANDVKMRRDQMKEDLERLLTGFNRQLVEHQERLRILEHPEDR